MQSRHVLPGWFGVGYALDLTIRQRNPYVDLMRLIQVALLRRKQDGEESEDLNYALAATINGIASGLRNTG
jgi:phosphoenolpyruvate carboxylase